MKQLLLAISCMALLAVSITAQQADVKRRQNEKHTIEQLRKAKEEIDNRKASTLDPRHNNTLLTTAPLPASPDEDPIRQAMKDELARNIKRLKLDKMNPPFFISYEIRDVRRTSITASLGSLIQSQQLHQRDHEPKVLVGDYQRNNDHFMDMSDFGRMMGYSIGSEVPLENDYFGIRRALWLSTDNSYRDAADAYEKKIAAIEQQNLLEDLAKLPDLSKEKPVTKTVNPVQYTLDIPTWEECAKEVSAVFKLYPDIQSSRVTLSFIEARIWFVNSEGTDISYPMTLAGLQIQASTQADDGEPLHEQTAFYGSIPSQLPPKPELIKAAKDVADKLRTLRSAEKFNDTYTGPVLFEGQAAAELVAQRLFINSDGLIASREQISNQPGMAQYMGSGKSLEDRIGKKLLPSGFAIESKPLTKTYKGVPLIGAYEVDREGVVPSEKLTLVEDGVLKTLLNNRSPSKQVQQSNGHARLGTNMEAGIAPGVVHLTASKPIAADKIRAALLKTAKDEGLKYAIIVRQIASPTISYREEVSTETIYSFAMSFGKSETTIQAPLLVYKVDVETGKESLVRSVKFGGIAVGVLKDILAAGKDEYIYNTLASPGSSSGMGMVMRMVGSISDAGGSGYPATFIVPGALLFKELEMKKIDRASTPKLPIVPSPLSEK